MTALIRLADKLVVAPLVALAGLVQGRRPRAAPSPPPAAAGRCVVVKLVGLGDAVLMLPALAALRAQPGAEVTVITTRRAAPVFTAPGVTDRVIVIEPRGGARRLREAVGAIRAADTVLDFEQHVYWSTLLTLGARRGARRHGFRTASRVRNRAYDRLVDPGRAPRPMKTIFDELAQSAGVRPKRGLLPLPASAAARRQAAAWLEAHGLGAGGYAVLAPGSGASVSFRRLPASAWAEIAGGLPRAWTVIVAGTALERELAEEIARRAPRPVTVELEFGLETLACIFAGAARVIATDSGPMHLAAAMGAPVTGIFGPDTPQRYGPIGERAGSVWLGLSCSPCNNCWVYREARCTNPERYACVRRIGAELVLAAGSGRVAGDGTHHDGQHHGAQDGNQNGVDQAAARRRAQGQHDPSANDRAHDAEQNVQQRAVAGTVHDLARSPAGDQAHDDPPDQEHGG